MSFKPPSCLKRQLEIRLNVYDLIEANKYGAGAIGAFHSGCDIDGVEYSFGLNDYDPPRTGTLRLQLGGLKQHRCMAVQAAVRAWLQVSDTGVLGVGACMWLSALCGVLRFLWEPFQ